MSVVIKYFPKYNTETKWYISASPNVAQHFVIFPSYMDDHIQPEPCKWLLLPRIHIHKMYMFFLMNQCSGDSGLVIWILQYNPIWWQWMAKLGITDIIRLTSWSDSPIHLHIICCVVGTTGNPSQILQSLQWLLNRDATCEKDTGRSVGRPHELKLSSRKSMIVD